MTDERLPPVPRTPDLRELLVLVMDRISEFLEVERSTLFLLDPQTQELWTPVAQGMGSDEIRIPLSSGVAGHVMVTGETVAIEDPYSDPRFNPEVDRKTGFRTRNVYCRPLASPGGDRIGVIQLLNRRGPPLDERRRRLLDALCAQAAIAIENVQLFLKLKDLRDSEQRLHDELARKHAELQRAFVQLEQAALNEARWAGRVNRVKLWSLAGAAIMFLGLGLFAWRGPGEIARPAAPSSGGVESTPVYSVERRPLKRTLTLMGIVEPLEIRNLTVSLRGRVAEKAFSYGEPVVAGQLLARIDASDTLVELRNARAAHYRAEVERQRLEGWSEQPEVARAKRAVERARLQYEAHSRNLKEMEQLAALGIIAQSSLDGARQQFTTQEADYRAAQEDLATILAQATTERITLAQYDVENAALRIRDLEARIAGAEMYAPFDGIVLLPQTRPPAGRPRDHDGLYEVGSAIAQNDILLAVGNLEGISVKTRADEVDILHLRHGQPVRIGGDALGGEVLHGAVSYLSSQAIPSGGRPFFEVVVQSDPLTDDQRRNLRLGITAKLEITTAEIAAAMAVPIVAVGRDDRGTYVWRRQGRVFTRVSVELGMITPEWAEVRSGLEVEDTIASRAADFAP